MEQLPASSQFHRAHVRLSSLMVRFKIYLEDADVGAVQSIHKLRGSQHMSCHVLNRPMKSPKFQQPCGVKLKYRAGLMLAVESGSLIGALCFPFRSISNKCVLYFGAATLQIIMPSMTHTVYVNPIATKMQLVACSAACTFNAYRCQGMSFAWE